MDGRDHDGTVRPTTATRPSGSSAAVVKVEAVSESLSHLSTRRPLGRRVSAAFFDLDKTIIAKSSVLAFGRPFYQGGLINRRAVLRSAYAQFVFALSGADADQIERMRAYLTRMCSGWDVNQVREIVADTLHRIIDPIVYDEAVALIEQHKAAGRDVVIVSTSGAEVVRPIGEMLGADHVVATEMVQPTATTPARSPATSTPRRKRPRSANWPRRAATT